MTRFHKIPRLTTARPVVRFPFALGLWVMLGTAFALGGCSTGAILGDKLPEAAGGLPTDAPARPQDAAYRYPAVHDMPPERATQPMNDTEQVRVEKELETARDRLESKAETLEKPAEPADPTDNKKPDKAKSRDAKGGQASGAARKP
jgi:hypothetical protein